MKTKLYAGSVPTGWESQSATIEGDGDDYFVFSVDGFETTAYINEDATIRLVPTPTQIYEP